MVGFSKAKDFWLTSAYFQGRPVNHLSFGCGSFGIDERQSIATESKVILQDQSRLRGRAKLTGQQAESNQNQVRAS